ncbi:VOC family protein [Mycobacterium sp.]|uniref:VOC family protein n=1 Tax=Mycobacterium sp. TaxID=1785 RepID=UPI003BAF63D8
MIPIGRFHHIGIATESIARDEAVYAQLGYEREGGEFLDAGQGVRGVFLVGPGPRLELLEPYEGSTTLEPWLQAGSRLYHQAYEVDDLDASLGSARKSLRAHVIRAPMPAPAFGGRPVSFLMLRNRSVIELIQAEVQ